MSSPIIINLPAAVIGQQPAASENPHNPQRQFADVLSSSSSLDTGECADFSVASDKMPSLSPTKNSTNVKEAFSEKFKRAIAAVSDSDTANADLNTDPLVLQQNSNIEAVIPDLTGTIDSTAEKPDVPAISPNAVLPIETTMLPLVNEDNSIPTDNGIGQESYFVKSDIINSTTIPTDNGIGQKSYFVKTDIVKSTEPADNLTAVSNTQSNQTEAAKDLNLITDVKPAEVKSENLEPLPQTVVAAKNSSAIKPADAEGKEQNTVSNQNSGQKIGIPQPQTNAENSSQTPFEQSFSAKQNFDGIYLKTEDIESISLGDKKSGDSQMLPIQETKTAGGSEKISSPIAADLKTDIQQETGEISRQIADSIKSAASSSEKQITVRLNPAELGKVVIKVSGEHSQISTIIEASNPETKSQLQEAFGQVAKNLADAGITIRHFEVKSTEQSSGGFESAFSQSGQSGQSSQGENSSPGQFYQSQNPTEGGFYYQNQIFDIKNSSPEQNFSQNHFTARSVNMLA